MSHDPHPLKHLMPGWYAIVMGLSGLSLAWYRAVPVLGELAHGTALVVGLLAALVFALLALATVLRGWRHPEAWAEDRRHPVRHTFIATLPISVILLATVAVAMGLPQTATRALWWAGSLSQLVVTWWVLARWWRGAPGAAAAAGQPAGLAWGSATPALFIPVVGNVLAPLAGVPLGHADWAIAQFGVGLMFWPLVMALIVVRIVVQGMWPERLLPATFIFIAPPAVVGLAALQLGAPQALGWMLWGMALFTVFWVAALAGRIAKLPFGMAHWGMSFPLAAMTALTLRLAEPGSAMSLLGLALLALASLVIAVLALATLRGLRDGTLLVPEVVAPIVPAAG
jgi:tellurite resistance protein